MNKSKFFNAFSSKITLSRRAIVASVLAVTIFPSVSLVLIHPPTALALDCNDCTERDESSGGGVFGSPPPGWEIFLKNTEPATALDVPGRGEPGVSAVLDGVPGSALSTPGGDAGSAPDNKTSPEEAQCRAKCRSSKICLADC